MLVFIRLSRFFTGQNFVSDQFNVTQPSKIVLNRTSCFQTIRCNGIVCCRWTPGHNHPQGAVASSHQFVREYCEERHSCNPVNWPTKHDARSYQLPLRNAAWNLWGFLCGVLRGSEHVTRFWWKIQPTRHGTSIVSELQTKFWTALWHSWNPEEITQWDDLIVQH